MSEGVNLVTQALADVTAVLTSAVDMCTSNPITMVFIGISIATAGIGLFRNLVSRQYDIGGIFTAFCLILLC